MSACCIYTSFQSSWCPSCKWAGVARADTVTLALAKNLYWWCSWRAGASQPIKPFDFSSVSRVSAHARFRYAPLFIRNHTLPPDMRRSSQRKNSPPFDGIRCKLNFVTGRGFFPIFMVRRCYLEISWHCSCRYCCMLAACKITTDELKA